jgi:hypothetical protein
MICRVWKAPKLRGPAPCNPRRSRSYKVVTKLMSDGGPAPTRPTGRVILYHGLLGFENQLTQRAGSTGWSNNADTASESHLLYLNRHFQTPDAFKSF